MINFDVNRLKDELEKCLDADGDLVLVIACTKCHAQYELNPESVAMAIGMGIQFIEYVRFVQSSKCRVCEDRQK
jgi:hypothetical protein